MNYSQVSSVVGAVLAIIIGALGIWQGWFGAGDGMGYIVLGLSILGVHVGGATANNS